MLIHARWKYILSNLASSCHRIASYIEENVIGFNLNIIQFGGLLFVNKYQTIMTETVVVDILTPD